MNIVSKILSVIIKKINEITYIGLGTKVQIHNYTTDANKYTVPTNGILLVKSQYASNRYALATVYDENNNELYSIAQSTSSSYGTLSNNTTTVMVFKGQKIKCQYSGSGNALEFYPFIGGGTK